MTPSNIVGKVIGALAARGLSISRAQQLHPAIDRAVRAARRRLYAHRFFRAGPRKRGRAGGRTFVILNHAYDLDIDALCAADTPHELWVLEVFALFTDVDVFFPPGQRDLDCVYGEGEMRVSIERFKAVFVREFARQLRARTRLDALIVPSDTFYYVRPLIEELRDHGIPTLVQDKEGTYAPSAMMTEHIRVMRTRYPAYGDHYYLWSEAHCELWRQIGLADRDMQITGQPRSDFFFHPERWPSKAALGLTEGKRLVVAFTFDSEAYVRGVDPVDIRPWKQMRDDLHATLRALAAERDDLEVVVKAHPQQRELDEVKAEFAAHPMPNVQLWHGSKGASELIVSADVIIGFQSTVMIEAMLTAKPVIYAGWGPDLAALRDELVPFDRSGGCTLVDGRAELERVLRAALDGKLVPPPEMMRARKAFTDRYFADADGHSAERVLTAMAAFVTAGPHSAGETR